MPDAADIRITQDPFEAHGTRRFLVHEATVRNFRKVDPVGGRLDAFRTLPFSSATEQGSEQQTEHVARLLAAMDRTPLSAREIMAKLGLTHRPTFLYSYQQPALAGGLIEMNRPDAPRARNQKYRITATATGKRLTDREGEQT